ncbi:MAG: hypothetical protein ABIR46_02370 [Candidatus Saccharimonadales bacterium]
MSELIAELGSEVKQFLDRERTSIFRQMSRTAIVTVYGFEVDIEQTKVVSPDDLRIVQNNGPKTLATPEWFNDVNWMQKPVDSREFNGELNLEAMYPMEYFEERPVSGLFKGDRWLDQYGAISGFGSNGQTNLWMFEFVTPGSRTVTRLPYPSDLTAIDQYNARYQDYLRTINEGLPTISYYRGWDRQFSSTANKIGRVLGGMSLEGLSANEVLTQGSPASLEEIEATSLLFHYQPEQSEFVGRTVWIMNDGEATVEPYCDGEDDDGPASEELLEIALELVRDVAKD